MKRKPLNLECQQLRDTPLAFIEALGPDYCAKLHPHQIDLLNKIDAMTKDGRVIDIKMRPARMGKTLLHARLMEYYRSRPDLYRIIDGSKK